VAESKPRRRRRRKLFMAMYNNKKARDKTKAARMAAI
jgi:hypothetical protein